MTTTFDVAIGDEARGFAITTRDAGGVRRARHKLTLVESGATPNGF